MTMKNTTIQNLWDAAKAVLGGECIPIQAYLKKQEKSQENNLTLYLKELEKEEQTKPKVSRRKEMGIETQIEDHQSFYKNSFSHESNWEALFSFTLNMNKKTLNCCWQPSYNLGAGIQP